MSDFPLPRTSPPRSLKHRWSVAALILVVAVLMTAPVHADVNPVEQRARKAYASADYQTAVDLFAQLYAETLHPTYLRNIGRCHQLMGNADRAITSFEEYLRKAKVDEAERKEIQGYIKEMEDRRTRQDKAPIAEPGPVAAPVAGPVPRPVPEPVPTTNILTEQPEAPKDDDGGILNSWWFWTIVGAAVVTGGVAILVSGGNGTSPACPADRASCK
jgi:hypothetical protein